MEIKAELRFKHGRIANIIKNSKLNIRKVAEKSGWIYSSLLSFINLKGYPKSYDEDGSTKFEKLFVELWKLDNTLTFEEVKPNDYNKAIGIFSNKESTHNIDIDSMLEYDYIKQIEYNHDNIEKKIYKKETKKYIEKIIIQYKKWKLNNYNYNSFMMGRYKNLSDYKKYIERNIEIIEKYFGFKDATKNHTYKSLSKEYNLLPTTISNIIDEIIHRLREEFLREFKLPSRKIKEKILNVLDSSLTAKKEKWYV